MSWLDDYMEDVANHIVKNGLMKEKVEDPIVLKVMSKFYDRSQRGIEKYGTMLTRTDLDFIDWVTHLQEEMLDAALYCERLKDEYKTNKDKG